MARGIHILDKRMHPIGKKTIPIYPGETGISVFGVNISEKDNILTAQSSNPLFATTIDNRSPQHVQHERSQKSSTLRVLPEAGDVVIVVDKNNKFHHIGVTSSRDSFLPEPRKY